jgi:hypothetical protein
MTFSIANNAQVVAIRYVLVAKQTKKYVEKNLVKRTLSNKIPIKL